MEKIWRAPPVFELGGEVILVRLTLTYLFERQVWRTEFSEIRNTLQDLKKRVEQFAAGTAEEDGAKVQHKWKSGKCGKWEKSFSVYRKREASLSTSFKIYVFQ